MVMRGCSGDTSDEWVLDDLRMGWFKVEEIGIAVTKIGVGNKDSNSGSKSASTIDTF